MTSRRSASYGFREDGQKYRAKPVRNGLTSQEAELEWVVRMLWRAFPEADSENELSDLVADHLSVEGREVSPRTVRYWLRKETSPHFRYIVRILALAGAESAFDLIFSKRDRH